MRIAIIGGGASGMTTAYLLDQQRHDVTVFERQDVLGGHIRTLNKNVQPNQSDCDEILENGVLEFPTVFHHFMRLMQELEVELEPIKIGSAMFFKNGSHLLSSDMIQKNFTGFPKLIEYLRLETLYASSVGLWLRTKFAKLQDLYDHPLSAYLQRPCIRNTWLKLLVMYSYSMPLALIDDFPAEMALPVLRDDVAVDWVSIKGGVYSYIEKILARFKGEVVLNVEIDCISRSSNAVKIRRSTGQIQQFDKVVFATPPDQVMMLLADPSEAEIRRFSAWRANYATTLLHSDRSMYDRYGIKQASEFDFFQTENDWGYNSCLNQLCNISSSQNAENYFLSFQLEEIISRDRIIHIQEHHTPLYTTESFKYRDEVNATNGENNTFHAGAYLGDGLHEGAIASAYRVAQLVGVQQLMLK
jgi:predicted NAD/FAD-binding protein